VKIKEDRRRLVQLLQLAEPIEQTIKLYYDRRPEKMEKYTNFNSCSDFDPDSIALNKSLKKGSTYGMSTSNSKRCSSSKKHTGGAKKQEKIFKTDLRISPSDEKQQIIRTIMFPDENVSNTANEENEFLRRQLMELRYAYENQIMKMEEDRRLREEEFRLHMISSSEKIEELVNKNQKLEKLNYELTKDYMHLKYDTSLNEKKVYEELELVKLQNEALGVTIKDLAHKSNIEKETHKNDYDKKTKEISKVMRTQVKSQEENINIIKEQYKQIQKIYTTRVKELESKLKNLTDKCGNLEQNKKYQIEGYINEINLMRKRLKSYEDYVAKLRRMTDGVDDRYEDINDATRTNNGEFLAKTRKTKVYTLYILLFFRKNWNIWKVA
jgi:hypothetical protein